MLEEFELLNGKLSLKFDPLNTKYTVIMDNKEDKILEFNYKIKEGDEISIFGNNLVNDYNEVVITIYNETESMNYYFYVYKENETNVVVEIPEISSLEAETKKEISPYAAPGISSICFLIILITFAILFHKKKKKV